VITAAPSGALFLATAAMGTRFELMLYAGDRDRAAARALGEAALDEIESCHRRLSRFAMDSLVAHINRTAAHSPVRLDRDTFALVQDALAVQRASAGAFDITVAPARPGVHGVHAIELDARTRTIRLRAPGIMLDLGAIAKGHAIDLAAALLRAHGIRSALLHGGTSSVAAIGTPPDQDGWHVRIGSGDDAPIVPLRDATLSVSSPAGGGEAAAVRRDGHIIDPRTGGTARGAALVAVIGPSARLGDAWATAIAVTGERPRALAASWTTLIRLAGRDPLWSGPASPVSN
jgi:FAD:protein FMN transferase